jgi:hypothetical protein
MYGDSGWLSDCLRIRAGLNASSPVTAASFVFGISTVGYSDVSQAGTAFITYHFAQACAPGLDTSGSVASTLRNTQAYSWFSARQVGVAEELQDGQEQVAGDGAASGALGNPDQGHHLTSTTLATALLTDV